MEQRIRNLSIVTAHFADFGWIRLLVDNIFRYTDASVVREIIIINQDRSPESRAVLLALHPKVRVVEYPRSEPHFKKMSHDHAAVLNQAMTEVKGEFVCLFDSDAHPTRSDWLKTCGLIMEDYDAVLACDPHRAGYSHPCFMLFPASYTRLPLKFDDDLFTESIDTGRLIGRQLKQAGASVFFASGTIDFGGLWGYTHMGCIYHHSHGSFAGGDHRLQSQLNWEHEFFARIVRSHQRYGLTFMELLHYKALLKWHARFSRKA